MPCRPQRCGVAQPWQLAQHHAGRCVAAQALLHHRHSKPRGYQAQCGKGLAGFHGNLRSEPGADAGGDEIIGWVGAGFALHADPLLFGQVLGQQLALPGQWMLFGQGQQHRVVEHLQGGQVRVVGGRRFAHQGDVQAALAQALQLLQGRQVIQLDVHGGPVIAQDAQGIGQYAGMHGIFDIANAQAAFFPTAQALAQGFQAIGVGQQRFGFGQEGLAVAGQADALLAALEQGQAQPLFELGDLAAQGRLRDVQALGGAADVFFLGDHFEVAQLA